MLLRGCGGRRSGQEGPGAEDRPAKGGPGPSAGRRRRGGGVRWPLKAAPRRCCALGVRREMGARRGGRSRGGAPGAGEGRGGRVRAARDSARDSGFVREAARRCRETWTGGGAREPGGQGRGRARGPACSGAARGGTRSAEGGPPGRAERRPGPGGAGRGAGPRERARKDGRRGQARSRMLGGVRRPAQGFPGAPGPSSARTSSPRLPRQRGPGG